MSFSGTQAALDEWVHATFGVNPATYPATPQLGGVAGAAPAAGTLPQPMGKDCKVVHNRVPGPENHLLCSTHGHVVDITARTIIAHDVKDYEKRGLGGQHGHHGGAAGHKPGAAAHKATPQAAQTGQQAGQQAAPPPPPPAAAAPAQPPSNAAAPPAADVTAARAQAEAKQLLTLMQLEMEDIANVRSQHEDLAGGGRFNRAISWASDKLGGADDPGDDLAEIAGQMMTEHIGGMAAVGALDLGTAHKHLATMQALSKKAHALWRKYTGDTETGGERAVTGLTVVSKAGDIATAGLNVVAPGAGKVLSVVKNVAVAGSKLAFGEKVNWTEFTVDMAFDLFVGGEGGQVNKAAEKLAGPLAKDLAPKLSEAIAKKWGLDAIAKKLGGKVTEAAIEKYIVTEAEELIKNHVKDMVSPIAENVVEAARGKDVTHEQLVDMMHKSLMNPSGQLAGLLSEKLIAEFKP